MIKSFGVGFEEAINGGVVSRTTVTVTEVLRFPAASFDAIKKTLFPSFGASETWACQIVDVFTETTSLLPIRTEESMSFVPEIV